MKLLKEKIDMSKFNDYTVSPEVTDIMEKILERFPTVFPGFDVNKIGSIHAHDKESKKPIKLTAVKFPYDVYCEKTYICSVSDGTWKDLTQKQKNLAVFHIMCSIPEGGFDSESNKYGRVLRPDIQVFSEEFAVSGGVPNWMENPDATDPMEANSEDVENVGD
jgi:hypothetical protein